MLQPLDALDAKVPSRILLSSPREWRIKLESGKFLKHIQGAIISTYGSVCKLVSTSGQRNLAEPLEDGTSIGLTRQYSFLRSTGVFEAVYWWNGEIDELRKNHIRTRRIYTRARRRGDAEEEHNAYKEAKKQLKNSIYRSKRQKWEELRADINNNPWGLGYRVVMQKLGMRNSVAIMDEDTMRNIVDTLFPMHDTRVDLMETDPDVGIPLFTAGELQTATYTLKDGKAPGPDGIPAEVMKVIAVNRPEILLRMYNVCLTEGIFPDAWKEQKLVLISKGTGDRGSPSSYRPLCMLNTAGKLFERLLKPRLNEAINAAGGL